jgi:hypothetical protein
VNIDLMFQCLEQMSNSQLQAELLNRAIIKNHKKIAIMERNLEVMRNKQARRETELQELISSKTMFRKECA